MDATDSRIGCVRPQRGCWWHPLRILWWSWLALCFLSARTTGADMYVRGAIVNDARYEAAPLLSAMNAQNNNLEVPPPLPSPTKSNPPWKNGVSGPAMPESRASLQRNSLTLRGPVFALTTMMAYQATMHRSARKFCQTQSPQPQPHLSREPSTRQSQPFPSPNPPGSHHTATPGKDTPKYKRRRERERPMDFFQSPAILSTTATDLSKPLQSVHPARIETELVA